MRKSRLYSSLIALLSSAAVSAAAAAPIPDACLACKGETGDAAFMACLDKCINNPSPEAEILPAKPIDLEAAGWTLDTSVNAMTDVKTYYPKSKETLTSWIAKGAKLLKAPDQQGLFS